MKFMIQFTVTEEYGLRIEASPGGPGPIIGYIVERLKPEAMYMNPTRRGGFMVAELDEAKLAEAMVYFSSRCGAYPTFTPVMTGEAFGKIAAGANEFSAKGPKI